MTKGTTYLLLIAIVIFNCVVGEIRYRIHLKKLPSHLNKDYFVSRLGDYCEAIPITMITAMGVVMVIGMINTWNDPIQ